jgi:hypothetical protein
MPALHSIQRIGGRESSLPEQAECAAVRRFRFSIVALATALTVLPAALAADTVGRRFMVTGHATLTKRWTYTAARTASGCTSHISAKGLRTITLRTSGLSAIRGFWSGGDRRAQFIGAIHLGGTVTQSGTKTTRVTGIATCDTGTRTVTCPRLTRTFSGRSVGLLSTHAHRIGFKPLRGIVAPTFYGDCPGEPSEIRRLSNELEAADVGYKEQELFAPSTGGYGVGGEATITTHVYKTPGVVVQRVRWTVLFRRVG